MNLNKIRQKYLNFYKKNNHFILKSASLLPENDPTTLFTGSGMQPIVPYLLGQKHPQGKRLVNSQKCFRTNDIEDIGDNRHTTFFEMLGNWSLGDYFKKEQIEWMFNFLIDEIGIDPNRLYVTVYRGNNEIGVERDFESVNIWKTLFAKKGINAIDVDFSEQNGMGNGRIFYYDDKKNWWSRAGIPQNMPNGEPGGPDSEMFWDFGIELKLHENSIFSNLPCHVNCDCGRFLEIGNNVFMQYKKSNNIFEQLPNKNVDFGGGLERIAMALSNKQDIFLLDVFDFAKNKLEELINKKYNESKEITKSFRVILDHLRAVTFLICDGAVPSNKDQGYFTRRLIRRAIRFAYNLDIKENFCKDIVDSYIQYYQNVYPELKLKSEFILNTVFDEEIRFSQTIDKGIKEFKKIIQKFPNIQNQNKELNTEDVFKLFDTYGFPIELTIELAKENGFSVNEIAFNKLLKKHREVSKLGFDKKFKGGLSDHSEQSIKYHTTTHLLHQALRDVLGGHICQKGSNITPERLRFDFTHAKQLTNEEKKQVEDIINTQIQKNHKVIFEEMSVKEAKQNGAIGLFEEKYQEKVKVYSIGNYSKEICGGPHVEFTGTLGKFKILKEEASSAGVRRIKAVLE